MCQFERCALFLIGLCRHQGRTTATHNHNLSHGANIIVIHASITVNSSLEFPGHYRRPHPTLSFTCHTIVTPHRERRKLHSAIHNRCIISLPVSTSTTPGTTCTPTSTQATAIVLTRQPRQYRVPPMLRPLTSAHPRPTHEPAHTASPPPHRYQPPGGIHSTVVPRAVTISTL